MGFLNGGKAWSDEQIIIMRAKLASMKPSTTLKSVAEELQLQPEFEGRTWKAIHAKMRRMRARVHHVSPVNQPTEEDKPDPTDARVLALEQQLHTQKEETKKYKAKANARMKTDALFSALADHASELITPFKPAPMKLPTRKTGATKESLVLHLSDGHCDQVVLPSRCGGMEEYNLQVAMARGERLVDSTLDWAINHLIDFEFEELIILAYGDHVNGEIHGSVHHSEYLNTMKNTLAVGQLHAQMIRELAAYFPQVNVLYLSGNHGRRTTKKEMEGPQNNWDWMVSQMAAAYLRDVDNVSIQAPDSFDAMINIRGWNFHVQHGDDIRSFNSIPWYGIERATRRMQSLKAVQGEAVHYNVFGHFHQCGTTPHTAGETIINGAWLGTTPYVYNSLKSYSEPTQLLHGVHKKHGMSWRLPVRLKFKGDTDGPKRYKVEFSE